MLHNPSPYHNQNMLNLDQTQPGTEPKGGPAQTPPTPKKKVGILGIKIMFGPLGPLPSKNISAQAPTQQGKISRLT